MTVTLPDAGKRFMSMLQVINEDEYTLMVAYAEGSYALTKEKVGTRYVLVAIRTLVDPWKPEDVQTVHSLQDAIKVSQVGVGQFETPNWDPITQKRVRETLLSLAADLPDAARMFGTKDQVDPVRLYRPRTEILTGSWRFPEARPVS